MPNQKPPVIGILGGIGSGKSSVIRAVKGWNLVFIDADKIGHDLLKHPLIIAKLREAFGDQIFEGKDVNRSQLADVVFEGTEQSKLALETLNSILHPEIRTEILNQIHSADKDVDAVILDAALLLEGGWAKHCDHLIFIDTPFEIRQQRVIANRGWDQNELQQREARQIAVADKKSQADYIVDNSRSLKAACEDMTEVLTSILNP